MLKIKQIEEQIQLLLKNGCTRQELSNLIREKTGLKETQVRFYVRHYFGPEDKRDGIKIEKSPTEQTLQYAGDDLINVENLLKKCNVDSKKWEVSKFTLEEKHITKKVGDSIEFCPKYDVKAWLSKKEIDQQELLKEFIEEAAKHSPKSFSKEQLFPKGPDKKFLLEIGIYDSHLSKLCWRLETGGQDYDIKIAVQLFKNAVEDLLSKTPLNKVERIVFPVGNDFFNSDNELYTTTAGTPQHDDSRWQKSFAVGCNLLTETIEKLSGIAPVDVIVVAGNHDRQKVFYLGEYLNAWFKNNSLININNSPNKRKYYRYHKNLFGFCHGNEEKHPELPLIMAREAKEDWGDCDFYYWRLGHWHHQTTKDYKGVIVNILPSLCPVDEYHAKKGFVHNSRGSQAFLYHRDEGLAATFFHTVKD